MWVSLILDLVMCGIDENRMLLAFMGIFTFLVRLSVLLYQRSTMLIVHRSTHTPSTPHQP